MKKKVILPLLLPANCPAGRDYQPSSLPRYGFEPDREILDSVVQSLIVNSA